MWVLWEFFVLVLEFGIAAYLPACSFYVVNSVVYSRTFFNAQPVSLPESIRPHLSVCHDEVLKEPTLAPLILVINAENVFDDHTCGGSQRPFINILGFISLIRELFWQDFGPRCSSYFCQLRAESSTSLLCCSFEFVLHVCLASFLHPHDSSFFFPLKHSSWQNFGDVLPVAPSKFLKLT